MKGQDQPTPETMNAHQIHKQARLFARDIQTLADKVQHFINEQSDERTTHPTSEMDRAVGMVLEELSFCVAAMENTKDVLSTELDEVSGLLT